MKVLNGKKSIVLCLLLVGLTLFSSPAVDTAQKVSDIQVVEGLRPKVGNHIAGRIEGSGTRFELADSDYLDITLKSSESVHLMLESIPEMVVMNLEASEPVTSTKISISGFLPSTIYYKYEDNYHNAATFTTDASGNYSYIQDLAESRLVFIKPRPSTKFIPTDTSIGTWDPAGRIYTLSTDVYETIQIDEDNLTLDGAGHIVTGDGSGVGVYLPTRTSVTVKNLTVAGFSYGIHLYNSSGNTITENTSSSNRRYGIYLSASSNNTVTNNVTSHNHEGIFLHNSSGNSLTSNSGSDNYSGIYLYYNCNNNTLTDNTASKNSHGIYLYKSSENTLTVNTANSNSHYGIYLYDNSNNNILTDNTASWNNSNGIYLYNSSSNTLIGNTVSRNYPGIYFYNNCNNNILTGNTASYNYYGIYLYYKCNNNEIYNNNFINNQTHAYVYSSTGNVFNLARPTGGNFWSGWTTPNADGDVFVDDPYVFSSGQDDLPWVRQNAWTNLPPTADAGSDKIAHPRDIVTLNGSGSSDPELDYPLAYSWQFTSKPAGSIAVLTDADTASPSFTVDKLGDYTIELLVTDTLGAQSAADEVVISTSNAAPVAEAGTDQIVHPRDIVTLDGSASFDPEQDYPLAYSWQLTSKPDGSIAELSDADTVGPSFTVDKLGDYVIELIVTDSLGAQSKVDEVVIDTFNTAPVAKAGPDQTVHPRDIVTLDGSGSSDPEQDYPLAYSWQFTSKPAGSIAVLSDADTVSPSFTVDKLGDYVIELVVTDSLGEQSTADQVVIDTFNTAPVADAGPDQIVHPRDIVTLDGSGSSDPEQDYPLKYSWRFTSKPDGSIAVLSDTNTVSPSFTVDKLGDYHIELIVTDSLDAQSIADEVVIGTFNTAPVADAGQGQTVHPRDTVTLDGSASSDPEQDYPLAHAWQFVSKPAGSTVVLAGADTVGPSFTVDKLGDYVIELIVTDSLGAQSTADQVVIGTFNTAPVAEAGQGQIVHPRDTVTLDGSGSSDPEQDYPLAYSWQFASKPAGSIAVLAGADTVSPSFTVDKLGDYVVELVVTDSLGAQSAADQVVIGTFNTAPVALAGPDQVIIQIGTTVSLDGTGSSDPEGDGITYLWTITQKPAGSSAQLSDPASPTPAFVADVHADFVITLVVTDEFGAASNPDSVTVSFDNIPPVADAGVDQTVMASDTVSLDGSASSDTNGDVLTYSWSFVSRPAGSTAAFSDPTSAQPSFVTDEPGDYVVSLVVNDGFVDSVAATVTITAISHQQQAIQALLESIDVVANLDQGILKNGNESRDSLINKINAVLGIIDQQNYATAEGKLQNDVVERMDGCITVGSPDSNDWIMVCEGQGKVHPLIIKAQGHLKKLF